ncbi:MAG: hypothetical protein R3B70_47415 [Polyangiaceae bacterium]
MLRAASEGDEAVLNTALADAVRARELRPEDTDALVMECSVRQYACVRKGAPDDAGCGEALSVCTEAVRAAPGDADPLRFLSRLYNLTCQDDRALQTLGDALELDRTRTGKIASDMTELALQNGRLSVADRVSAELVAFQELEEREGRKALARRAGVAATRGGFFLRAAVLLRLSRWEEAAAALNEELSRLSSGRGDTWTELSALLGKRRLAGRGSATMSAAERGRLSQLEQEISKEVTGDVLSAITVADTIAMMDPAAAEGWLARVPASPSCEIALRRSAVWRTAGDTARARTEAAACQPRTAWEKRCAEWASH